MDKIIKNTIGNGGDYLFAVSRILIGLMFFQHGLQKMFGMFGGIDGMGGTPAFPGLFWWAGLIEFVAGLAITLGIFTSLFALISAIEMAVAYFIGHFPQGLYPISNGGELAVLFFAAFLIVTIYGARKWSLEKAVLGREIF